MYYKGNLKRCEDYNAIVSYNENFKDVTSGWSDISERDGSFYIIKHPDYAGTYLTEAAEMPFVEMVE